MKLSNRTESRESETKKRAKKAGERKDVWAKQRRKRETSTRTKSQGRRDWTKRWGKLTVKRKRGRERGRMAAAGEKTIGKDWKKE